MHFRVAFKALGVAADIYLKLFDGSKYIDDKPQKAPVSNVLAPDVAIGLVNHLVGLADSCETVKGVEDLYRDNKAQIERLPDGQKEDLLCFLGERKAALKVAA
jgi:hypothetical protein